MAFDEDLTAFFDPADFADRATIAPANGAPSFQVDGILDAPFLLARARDVEVATDRPTFMCRSVDVANVDRGDRLTVKGQTYDVLEPQPDGTGVTVLVLGQP